MIDSIIITQVSNFGSLIPNELFINHLYNNNLRTVVPDET